MRHYLRYLSYFTALFACSASAARAQEVDTSAVRRALKAFDAACASPAARVWSRDVCGPVILVDRGSRAAFANRADPDGQFVRDGAMYRGHASDNIPYANTSFAWKGQRWAVVMLPLPELPWSALALLTHESTHRLQDSLGWKRTDVANAHLDTEMGRLWWRLELRALQHALTTTGTARRTHALNAMRFRLERQRLFPSSAASEDALEYAEGTAEYLGERVAHGTSNLGPLMTVNYMRAIETSPTLVRGAAYATGPALGLLLDALAPGWAAQLEGSPSSTPSGKPSGKPSAKLSGNLTGNLTGNLSGNQSSSRSMSGLLMLALDMPRALPGTDSLRRLAEPYGYVRIAREETDRARKQRETRERLTTLLVTGPTVSLRQEGASRSFDPNTLIPFDSLGTVYPTGTFEAVWGRLEVSGGGALLSSDGRLIRVAATGRDNTPLADGATGTIRGAEWELTLNAGWRLRAGARAGDFEVSKMP